MLNTTQQPATVTTPKESKKATVNGVEITVPEFGNGRYSPEMERIWKDCQQLFGISSEKSEKIARQAGSDFGALMKNQTASMKIGKPNKDNKGSIGESVKSLKGVTLTMPLNIVRAIQWIGEAGTNGISYGHTKWRLVEVLETYVEELEVASDKK